MYLSPPAEATSFDELADDSIGLGAFSGISSFQHVALLLRLPHSRVTLISGPVAIDLLVVVWKLLEFARRVQADRKKLRAAQLKEDRERKQEANASPEAKAGAALPGTERAVSNVEHFDVVLSEVGRKHYHSLDGWYGWYGLHHQQINDEVQTSRVQAFSKVNRTSYKPTWHPASAIMPGKTSSLRGPNQHVYCLL